MPGIFYIIVAAFLLLSLAVFYFYFLKRRSGEEFNQRSPSGPAQESKPSGSLPAEPASQFSVDDLYRAIEQSKSKTKTGRGESSVSELHTDLLRKVGHEPEKVERLLALEKRKQTDFSERQLYRAAIESWERDNR